MFLISTRGTKRKVEKWCGGPSYSFPVIYFKGLPAFFFFLFLMWLRECHTNQEFLHSWTVPSRFRTRHKSLCQSQKPKRAHTQTQGFKFKRLQQLHIERIGLRDWYSIQGLFFFFFKGFVSNRSFVVGTKTDQ